METDKRDPISEKVALSRMMRICSRKEYCSFEIRQKLKRLQQDDDTINRIIGNLHKSKFIDDERYARSYVSDKLRFSKWGKTKIAYTLRQKQIPDSIIEEVFSELPPDSLTESLRPLLEKKLKSVKGATEYDKRNKVIRYGLGRGFAMPDIIDCLDDLMREDS